ncbi:MAG: ABC transporter substrate-binding protein [Verrucomicrobiales bacterium]|jgi:1,4-dihydroxy-6-naphthoate synthase|nr:ABC transporter substrate-binding protein [Verrucomicrobiales bacterium]
MKQKITLGHSPDPDDAFMFYAMAEHKIPLGGYEFEHTLQDIQTLNERAFRGELDTSAVSIHAYAYLTRTYALMSCGASMGDNYGPLLVARQKFSRDELLGKKIAIPGKLTSAFLALMIYAGRADAQLDYIVVPFDKIFDTVRDGRADIGLLIHEGQLTYAREGFELCEDLGKWWFRETGGLPLPLGGNVVKKSLGAKVVRDVTDITRASIHYGLANRQAGVRHALPLGRGLDAAMTDQFIGMYVNELTLDYGQRGRDGIREFLRRGHAIGALPEPKELEFV